MRLSRDNEPSSRLVKYGLNKPLPSILQSRVESLSIASISNENVIALQILMMVAVVDKSSRPKYRDKREDYLSQDVSFLIESNINISRKVLPAHCLEVGVDETLATVVRESQVRVRPGLILTQHLCYIQVSGKDHNLQSWCSNCRRTSNLFATAGLGNCY